MWYIFNKFSFRWRFSPLVTRFSLCQQINGLIVTILAEGVGVNFFFLNTKRCWIPSTKFHWITKCHVSIWSGRCNHPSAWNDKTALAKTLYIPRQINVFWFLYQPNQLYCDVVQHHSSEVAEINFYKPPPSPHLKEKSFCPF